LLLQVSRTNISGESKGQEKCVWGCASGENAGLTNPPRVVDSLSELHSPGWIRGAKTILPLESMDPVISNTTTSAFHPVDS
jgi:hypothetical protein